MTREHYTPEGRSLEVFAVLWRATLSRRQDHIRPDAHDVVALGGVALQGCVHRAFTGSCRSVILDVLHRTAACTHQQSQSLDLSRIEIPGSFSDRQSQIRIFLNVHDVVGSPVVGDA